MHFSLYFCGCKKTNATLNSKILKLDAPYNVIYAGGKVGRHIATLMTWEDDEDGGAGVFEAKQYPIIDQGAECPAGTLVWEAELDDCRVVCKGDDLRVGLRWFAKIIEYDFQQEVPSEATYIWERLSMLGVKMVWDKAKDDEGEEYEQNVYEVSLSFEGGLDKLWVKSDLFTGFYFEARGSRREVFHELNYQRNAYEGLFHDDALLIRFTTPDGWEQDIVDALNQHDERLLKEDGIV